jgi:fibronectin-binding autotransporter adhesin
MRVLRITFWGRPTDDCAEARASGSAFGAAPPAARCVGLANTARRLLRGTAAIALGLAWSVGANAADLQWSANGVTPGGGGTGNWNTSAPALWFNGSTFQSWNNASLDNAIFGGTAGTATVTINAPVTAHNLTFNISGYTVARTGAAANTLTLSGVSPTIDVVSGVSAIISSVIAGTAGLTKAGLGTLTLSGINTYTGATNVNTGTLQAGVTSAFAPTSAFTVASGATLALGNFNQTIGSLAGAGTVTNGSTNARTLTTGGDNTSTAFSGVIQNGGPSATNLTKAGTGTFTLSGANTYTGTTTINAGTLALSGSGSIASSSQVNVANAAGTFDISGTSSGATMRTLNGVANSHVTLGGQTLTISNGSTTYAGIIQGAGRLTLTGGTQTLSGANTYTGTTTINGGTLAVSSDSNLGDTSGGLTFGGGTLQSTATFTSNRGVTLTGGGTFNTSAATTLTLGGVISGTGSLAKSGTGTLTLTGNSTYTGARRSAPGRWR